MAEPMAEKTEKKEKKFAPGKNGTLRSEEGLQSKKESDRRRGQSTSIAFPCCRMLRED